MKTPKKPDSDTQTRRASMILIRVNIIYAQKILQIIAIVMCAEIKFSEYKRNYEMKEYPVLFTTEMVNAILSGRKTQTRRVIKLLDFQITDTPGYDYCFRGKRAVWNDYQLSKLIEKKCPFGEPGDELWVRETWRIVSWQDGDPYVIQYKSDMTVKDEPGCSDDYDMDKYNQYLIDCSNDCEKAGLETDVDECYSFEFEDAPTRWRPSIHMPRWASRIQLIVKDVRVAGVQDIWMWVVEFEVKK